MNENENKSLEQVVQQAALEFFVKQQQDKKDKIQREKPYYNHNNGLVSIKEDLKESCKSSSCVESNEDRSNQLD